MKFDTSMTLTCPGTHGYAPTVFKVSAITEFAKSKHSSRKEFISE